MNGDEWVCIRNEFYFTYLAMMNRRQEEKFLDLLPINSNTQRPYPLPLSLSLPWLQMIIKFGTCTVSVLSDRGENEQETLS